jgi:transcriptional regulator with XRE-family HTH domain
MATIGTKIKKVHELRNLTQEHVAKKLGMSITGYGNIERDETDIAYSKIEEIATVFGMRTEDLICFDEKLVINFNKGKENQNNAAYIIQQVVSSDIQKLYEKQILLLEEKIAWLEEKLGVK